MYLKLIITLFQETILFIEIRATVYEILLLNDIKVQVLFRINIEKKAVRIIMVRIIITFANQIFL